jgi:hypothetical protein
MTVTDDRLRYRLLTGPDDAEFCRRVSEAVEEGYQLYGSPTMTYDGERIIVGQAVILVPEAFREAIPESLRKMMGWE